MSDDLVVCALLAFSRLFFDGRRAPCSGRVGSRKTDVGPDSERRGAGGLCGREGRRVVGLKGMCLLALLSFVAAGK